MANIISFSVPVNLNGYSLIIPSVSVGNVPQLSVDLLITSNNFKKVATVWHPAIIPSVGSDAFDEKSSEVSTGCELYVRQDLKVAVIQLRSGIEAKLALKFFDEFKSVVVEKGFSSVVILVSMFSYQLHNVNSVKFKYMTSKEETAVFLNNIGLEVMEADDYTDNGAGFGIRLFKTLESVLDCTVLIKYVSEGDNRPDALSVLELLYKFIEPLKSESISSVKWPISWKYVYGNPPPVGIY